MKMTEETRRRIIELSAARSISEVARAVGCGVVTVSTVLREAGVVRSAAEKTAIRARVRSEYVRAERRRAIFGLDQKSRLKVFSNKDRAMLKYCLRRKGYIFTERGGTTAYFNGDTRRDHAYEEKGRKLGLRFQQA